MKIGLLGGSFNPIHKGHIAIAKTAIAQAVVDQVWFLPSGNHPFKSGKELLTLSKRIELIKIAIGEIPQLKISKHDTNRKKPNYTSKLIKKLYKSYPEIRFYFIAGYDILEELPKWHNYNWLKKNVNFIIVNRPNIDKDKTSQMYSNNFSFIKMAPVDVSSSQIRDLVKNGEPISSLVPANIKDKIIEYYGN